MGSTILPSHHRRTRHLRSPHRVSHRYRMHHHECRARNRRLLLHLHLPHRRRQNRAVGHYPPFQFHWSTCVQPLFSSLWIVVLIINNSLSLCLTPPLKAHVHRLQRRYRRIHQRVHCLKPRLHDPRQCRNLRVLFRRAALRLRWFRPWLNPRLPNPQPTDRSRPRRRRSLRRARTEKRKDFSRFRRCDSVSGVQHLYGRRCVQASSHRCPWSQLFSRNRWCPSHRPGPRQWRSGHRWRTLRL